MGTPTARTRVPTLVARLRQSGGGSSKPSPDLPPPGCRRVGYSTCHLAGDLSTRGSGDRGRLPPNRFSLLSASARLSPANARGRVAATDTTGWPRRAQVRTTRRHAPPSLRTPTSWSSVPPLPQPMSVATAGVICGWLLAAPEEVCPHCCAALLRDVLGGQEPTGVDKARESVENRGKFGCSRACCGVLSTPSLAPQLPFATREPLPSPSSGTF